MDFSITPKELAPLLKCASQERDRRYLSRKPLEAFRFSSREATYFTLPATCTIFISLHSNPQFEDIRREMRARDIAKLQSLARLHKSSQVLLKGVDPEMSPEPIAILQRATALVDVHYRDRQLVGAVPISPDHDFAILPLPYNGGNLDFRQFRLDSFATDSSVTVEGFVVLHEPNATPLERSVFERIPEDAVDLHLLPFGPVSYKAVAALIVVATVHTPALGGYFVKENISRQLALANLSDQDIQDLGDIGSAERLLQLRRAALWS